MNNDNKYNILFRFSPEEQKALTIIGDNRWSTIDLLNIQFKMLGIHIIAFNLINRLLDFGLVIKRQGVFDVFYIVTKEFWEIPGLFKSE